MQRHLRLRRRGVLRAGAVLLGAGVARAGPPLTSPQGTLRLNKLRHATFLIELDDVRVLVNPCLARGLGAPSVWNAKDAPLAADALGRTDIICVQGSDAGFVDGATVRQLRDRDASVFVPSDDVAALFRRHGFRRVRVVVAGDRFVTRGTTVCVSPSREILGGPAVGFHLERAGRTVWHMGAPPALDVDSEPAAFAKAHPAEAVVYCAQGLSWQSGPLLTMDESDGLLLAQLAGARHAFAAVDDATLAPLGALVLQTHPALPGAAPPRGLRVVAAAPGVWYRVQPAGPG